MADSSESEIQSILDSTFKNQVVKAYIYMIEIAGYFCFQNTELYYTLGIYSNFKSHVKFIPQLEDCYKIYW